MDEVLALAATHGVGIERIDVAQLDRMSRGGVHQGVAADVEDARESAIEALTRPPAGGSALQPLLVVFDGIEDPHNAGAILRTCDAAGVTGVIRQTRHSAALD